MKKRLFCLLLYVVCLQGCRRAEPFDAARWKSLKQRGWHTSTRADMAEDLIARKLLPGRDTVFVKELLGPPDHHAANLYEYDLSMDYSSDVQPEHVQTLELSLEGDIVRAARVKDWRK